MTPASHPSLSILRDYALGALRPPFAVAVAAHLETCAACRSAVCGIEAACGEAMSDLPPAPLGEDALQRVMAGIERPIEPAPAVNRRTIDRIPFSAWRPLVPGIAMRKAKVGEGAERLYLLRVKAGMATLLHGHGGVEFTCVLKGAFIDGDHVFSAGDFVQVEDGRDHHPRATADGECICLLASERPLRPRTLVGRLLQLLADV